MSSLVKIPLREKKFAKSKLALLQAFLDHLNAGENLDEISIKALCEKAEVSQATFFNYFPKKQDLIVYYIALWTIEVLHFCEYELQATTYYERILGFMDYTAEKLSGGTQIMSEIIVYQARQQEEPDLPEITRAERLLAFPNLENTGKLPTRGLNSVVPEYVRGAIKNKELPPGTDPDLVVLAIISVFFGVPMILKDPQTSALIPRMYHSSLALIWQGAGGIIPRNDSSGPNKKKKAPPKEKSERRR